MGQISKTLQVIRLILTGNESLETAESNEWCRVTLGTCADEL